jgi:hypothetical protein
LNYVLLPAEDDELIELGMVEETQLAWTQRRSGTSDTIAFETEKKR